MSRTYLCSIVIGVFMIFAMSCKKSNTNYTDQDYKFFNLSQEGWKSQRIIQFIDDINYTATEVPLQYYLLKNIGNNPQKIDSVFATNSDERVIEIEFQHADQTDLLLQEYTNKTYEDAVKYMSFKIEKDFKVVTTSNDTIMCSGVHFERNFKVAPFKRLLLYFNDIKPEDNIQLIYQDNLFGNGIIKFNFKETPLKL